MGNKVSVVRGVKSEHFYDQQNGINEIWAGDVEIISRLPFGDSDQEQSSWPPGGIPKIPWHQFIIPLHKRDQVGKMNSSNASSPMCACDAPRLISGYDVLLTTIPAELASDVGVMAIEMAVFMAFISLILLANIFVQDEMLLLSGPERCCTKSNLQAQRKPRKSFIIAGVAIAISMLLLVFGLPILTVGLHNQKLLAWLETTFVYLYYWGLFSSCTAMGFVFAGRLFRLKPKSAQFNQARVCCSGNIVAIDDDQMKV